MITKELIEDIQQFRLKIKVLEAECFGDAEMLRAVTLLESNANKILRKLLKISSKMMGKINKL